MASNVNATSMFHVSFPAHLAFFSAHIPPIEHRHQQQRPADRARQAYLKSDLLPLDLRVPG